MAERIAAERGRTVLGIPEHLLADRTGIERTGKRRIELVHVNVQVHRRPVALIPPHVFRVR